MPYAFTLTTTIPASAQEIYDAWLDSLTHSEMTRSEANLSDEVGAEVSAWDGYISVCTACIHPRSRSSTEGAQDITGFFKRRL